MPRRSYTKDTLKFLFVAIVMMAGLHFFVLDQEGDRVSAMTKQLWEQASVEGGGDVSVLGAIEPASGDPSHDPYERESVYDDAVTVREVERFEVSDLPDAQAAAGDADALLGKYIVLQSPVPKQGVALVSLPSERGWQEEARDAREAAEGLISRDPVHQPSAGAGLPGSVHKTRHGGAPKVIVIIDDMGMSVERTQEVVGLPGPLTLAFLPYADGVREQAAFAKRGGHELIIHTPMEPMNGDLDMGPIALRTGMESGAFDAVLRDEVLTSFEGYAGINNHMGSRLTQDAEAMGRVMGVLKEKGLFFVDSKTISSSVAADTARRAEVPYAERDVFLDHYEDLEAVYAALDQLERTARRDSYAIAIGHPKPHTIEALQNWLPTLAAKGLELVPVSAVLERPWENGAPAKIVDARQDAAEPLN